MKLILTTTTASHPDADSVTDSLVDTIVGDEVGDVALAVADPDALVDKYALQRLISPCNLPKSDGALD